MKQTTVLNRGSRKDPKPNMVTTCIKTDTKPMTVGAKQMQTEQIEKDPKVMARSVRADRADAFLDGVAGAS